MKNVKKIADQIIMKRALSERQAIQNARLTLLNLAKNMAHTNPVLNELKKVIKTLLNMEYKL